MKKINVFLLFSLILIAVGYSNFSEFTLLRRGIKLSIEKEYSEADKVFKDAISRYDSKAAKSNSVVNLYDGMLYSELLDTTNDYNFHRGNSQVYLAEKEQSPNTQIEIYKKALDEYKLSMKVSDDINIKRNYEIIAMRIEKIEKQQQQNQENENRDKKDKKNEDNKNSDQKKNQDDNKQQNDQNQNKDSSENQQNNENKKEQPEKKNDQNQEQNNENKQENPESDKKDKSTEIKEALATLDRLENSEEQAFKNNERLEYLGGDTDESW